MAIERWDGQEFDTHSDVLVIGAGACGLCAALAASDLGTDVFVLEKTKTALGTTAMSTGLIPAAGTAEQGGENIPDNPDAFFDDIMAKNKHGADPDIVALLAQTSCETVEWLRDRHNVPLTLVDGFLYPGHSYRRMYGTPNRTGSELMASLERAVETSTAEIVTEANVTDLIVANNHVVKGIVIERPGGQREHFGCDALILASCGFAGNAELVQHYLPAMTDAVPFTHLENKGSALVWGQALNAQIADLDSYQGHGGLAQGHNIPILWPVIMEGGFQLNMNGERFSNESLGYSEQAEILLQQPGQAVWSVFDKRIYEMMTQFEDFQDAIAARAIVQAQTLDDLAEKTNLPFNSIESTFQSIADHAIRNQADTYGRLFEADKLLAPPYYAVKVTAALFHTQGGLCIDNSTRVLKKDGRVFPNLFAGGGAARGISGAGAAGYIAGNGLISATSLGKIAGREAAKCVRDATQ